MEPGKKKKLRDIWETLGTRQPGTSTMPHTAVTAMPTHLISLPTAVTAILGQRSMRFIKLQMSLIKH